MKISMLIRHVEMHNRKLKQDYVDILRAEVYHGSTLCVLYTRALWMLTASTRVGLVKLLLLAAGCCDY